MSPFDKLFQAQVDKLLSANDKRPGILFPWFFAQTNRVSYQTQNQPLYERRLH